MAIKAGQLDRRLLLRRPSTTRNTFGEDVETFVDVKNVAARYVPQTGREEFVPADGHSAKQSTIFEIRYRAGVGPKWRVVFYGSEYDVEDVAEVGRREGLRLTCFARNVVSGAP